MPRIEGETPQESNKIDPVIMERALLRAIVNHLPQTLDGASREQAAFENSEIGELLYKLGKEVPPEHWSGVEEEPSLNNS